MTQAKGGAAPKAPRRVLAGLIWLAAMAAGLAPAEAQRASEAECRAAAEARLAQAGIAAGEIREVTLARRSSGSEASRLVGYAAWVKLERCPGSVVVNLDTACRAGDVYGSGGCTIGGR